MQKKSFEVSFLRKENIQTESCTYWWSFNGFVLLALSFRLKFHNMSEEDPDMVKLLLPAMTNRGRVPKADELDDTVKQYECHIDTNW